MVLEVLTVLDVLGVGTPTVRRSQARKRPPSQPATQETNLSLDGLEERGNQHVLVF